MKRVTLREDRAPYLVDEEILSDEPVIMERNGQAVAAVIPMADYEAFLAWRATLDEPWPGEPPRTPEETWRRWRRWNGSGLCSHPVDAETARLLTSLGSSFWTTGWTWERRLRHAYSVFCHPTSKVFCDANVLTYAFLGVDETSLVCSELLNRSG